MSIRIMHEEDVNIYWRERHGGLSTDYCEALVNGFRWPEKGDDKFRATHEVVMAYARHELLAQMPKKILVGLPPAPDPLR
jgi:hypothetical protein